MPVRTVADLDWKNLPFGYCKTDNNIRYYFKDGKWSSGELCEEETISLNIASPCIHYGQQAFEGLKAFETKDGRVVVFRPEENAARLQRTAERILMPQVPTDMFVDAVERVIRANLRFVPPYGTGASLYIRPLLIGTGAKVGLGPAPEYIFMVLVTPVGPYYKGGFRPVNALVIEHFDRAAPEGVGDCKVGGNYAAGLPGGEYGHEKGFPIVLYLDPKEKKYVDEFGTSNFIGIKDKSYVTPASSSILPSITNKSLMTIAEKKLGFAVERRPVAIDELSGFSEIGAVGTAAVVTPIGSISYRDTVLRFGREGEAGQIITQLYQELTGIQYGETEDSFGWLHEIR
jgi:branched-chain amino acid aminotransferase